MECLMRQRWLLVLCLNSIPGCGQPLDSSEELGEASDALCVAAPAADATRTLSPLIEVVQSGPGYDSGTGDPFVVQVNGTKGKDVVWAVQSDPPSFWTISKADCESYELTVELYGTRRCWEDATPDEDFVLHQWTPAPGIGFGGTCSVSAGTWSTVIEDSPYSTIRIAANLEHPTQGSVPLRVLFHSPSP